MSGGKIPSLVSVFTTLFKNKHMVQSLPQSDSFRILFNSPELSEVQRSGFHLFLKKGIVEELSKISCIQIKTVHFLVEISIDAQNFRLVAPENNYRDCILKMKSYTCKLYVQAKILFKDKVSGELLYQTQPEWVLLADLPMMTKRGHFVINGSPRIVVHQTGRAPGIYFKKILKAKKDITNQARFYGDIIPRKGVWVRLQISKKGEIDLKLKKSKKVRAEMVQKCLELLEKEECLRNCETEAKLVQNEILQKQLFFNLKTELLVGVNLNNCFYSKTRQTQAFVIGFNKNHSKTVMYGESKALYKAEQSNDKTESVVRFALQNDFCTNKSFVMPSPKNQLLPEDGLGKLSYAFTKAEKEAFANIYTSFYKNEIQDLEERVSMPLSIKSEQKDKIEAPQNKKVFFRDLPLQNEEQPTTNSFSVTELPIELKDKSSKKNKSSKKKRSVKKQNIINNLEKVRDYLYQLFKRSDLYDLGPVGREKINTKFGISVTETQLTALDIKEAINWLSKLRAGREESDDIDHSQNRRVRTSSELIQTQFSIGITRLKNLVTKKVRNGKDEQIKASIYKQAHAKRSFSGSESLNNLPSSLYKWSNGLCVTKKELRRTSFLLDDVFRFKMASNCFVKNNKRIDNLKLHFENRITFTSINPYFVTSKQKKIYHSNSSKQYTRSKLQIQRNRLIKENSFHRGYFYPNVKQRANQNKPIKRSSVLPIPLLYQSFAPKLGFDQKNSMQMENSCTGNDLFSFSISEWFSTKPINGALREFFSSSPLSQYMDQTNPLAEVTHKRRLSSLGIGGVSRESAGMTIRGIHPTHYGRICPIETPEGKNAGLVNSLAFYAKINDQGFIETPYYQVMKGQIQHELGFSFYSAGQESRNGLYIAPNDIKQSEKSKLLATTISTVDSIPVRVADNLLDLFKKVSPYQVNCIGISPVQILSVATSLIPFLEHNDANRALMGSNMQRQAVSLMISERPLVGTGLEARVLAESGHLVQSKISGFVSNVSAHQVVVQSLSHVSEDSVLNQEPTKTEFQLPKHGPFTRPLAKSNSCTGQFNKAKPLLCKTSFCTNSALAFSKTKLFAFVSALQKRSFCKQLVLQSEANTKRTRELRFARTGKTKPSFINREGVKNKNKVFVRHTKTTLFDFIREANTKRTQQFLLGNSLQVLAPFQIVRFDVKTESSHIQSNVTKLKEKLFLSQTHKSVQSSFMKGEQRNNLRFYSFCKTSCLQKHSFCNEQSEHQEQANFQTRFSYNFVMPSTTIKSWPAQFKYRQAFVTAKQNIVKGGQNYVLAQTKSKPKLCRTKTKFLLGQEFLLKRDFSLIMSCVREDERALNKNIVSGNVPFAKKKVTLCPVTHSINTFSRSNQETCLTQKPLVEEGDWVQKGDMLSDCSAGQKGELSVGKNMLIAYIPWQGYNFEDAIVISDRLVKEQLYTSLHIERYTVIVNDFKDKVVDTNEWFTGNLPGVDTRKRSHLQKSGLPRIGTILREGDILVGKIKYSKKKPATPHEKLVCDILGEHNFSVQNTSLYVPKGVHEARVLAYKIKTRFGGAEALKNNLRPAGAPKVVHLFLGEKRNIQVGDKMSGRHGNKGIVSTILPKQDMPYLADGSPIDILLNPLGVPSRMNVGQVFECLLGLASTYLHQNFKVTAFDELYGVEASQSLVFLKLYQARLQSGQNWLFQVNFPGKTRLTDGRSGECLDQWITVGKAYMLKLIHMVNEKIHARAIGPYALVTQQPLKGRAHKGGQRLGEMEVWAVEGFGAAYILQELLTKKSDDSVGRKEVLKAMLPKSTSDFLDPFGQMLDFHKNTFSDNSASAITNGNVSTMHSKQENRVHSEDSTFAVLGQPDIFKVLICELQALCLDVGVYSIKTESFQRKFVGVFE